jgi:hypothetical protein
MPLLFLISGTGARHAMRTPLCGSVRPGAAGAAAGPVRIRPGAAGSADVLYIEGLGQPAFQQPYWRFWLSFVNVPALARGLLIRGSWTSGGVNFGPAHLRKQFDLIAG